MGQEVVARMEAAGRVSHLLVGLTVEGKSPLTPGTPPLISGASEVGEVTSSCVSPEAGPIALAFVRRAHADPGTALDAAGRPVRVARLPFAGPNAPAP